MSCSCSEYTQNIEIPSHPQKGNFSRWKVWNFIQFVPFPCNWFWLLFDIQIWFLCFVLRFRFNPSVFILFPNTFFGTKGNSFKENLSFSVFLFIFIFSFRLWLDLLLKKMFQQKFDNKKEDLFLYKQYAITLHFLLVLSFCNFIALEIRQDIRALSEAWFCVYKFVKRVHCG